MPSTIIPTVSRSSRAPATQVLTWRVIRDVPQRGARNMALDHALARATADGHATLRLYAWKNPTVSFGRNEPAKDFYSADAAVPHGVDYVRRPTGGRAVLHDDEVTYSVVAPDRRLGPVRVAYDRVNRALASALRTLGAPVALASGTPALALDAGPCFQSPASGEVVSGNQKLVGSAQARVEGALLQHGSIILSGDQSLLGALSKNGTDHPAPASLRALIGPTDPSLVADAIVEAFFDELGGEWSDGTYSDRELHEAERLEDERYSRDTWTWRC